MGDRTTTESAVRVTDWPLVGRTSELTALAARPGPSVPRYVGLAGPRGVGKTRLARECVTVARQLGMDTAEATATRSAAQIPFGAVASLLHATAPPAGALHDRFHLFRRAVAAFAGPPPG